ncbi:MAG: radical SAM protein [Syntrophales bacterium]|nr:radical SAM protein [Syntrophales bacterium]
MKIKKILLIFPPYPIPKVYPKRVQAPLGIIYLAGVLLREGYGVRLIDAPIEGWEKRVEVGNDQVQYGLFLEDIMSRVREEKPDAIGISCMFGVQLKNSRDLAEMIRSELPHMPIVMGGALASECAAQILEKGEAIDYIVIGEGEETFALLLRYLNEGKENPAENIDGIAYRAGSGKVIVNKKTKYIANLDNLSVPPRRLLPVGRYFELNRSHGNVSRMAKSTTIITSRGCPGKCIFCSIHSVWGYNIRFRSPENVVNEIIDLQKEFGITEFQIEDDNFTFDADRAAKICDLIVEKKINAKFSTPNGIAVWSLNKELMRKMKKAGFYKLTLAIESGSEHTLRQIIRKPLDLGKIKEIVKESLEQGFIVDTFFVIGFPGETPEDLKETFVLSRALNAHSVKYFIATPYPGTELYRLAKAKGMLDKDYLVDDFSMTPAKSVINTEYFTCREIDRIWLRETLKTQLFLFLKRPVSYTKNVFLDYFKKDSSAIMDFLSAFLKSKKRA